MKQIENPAQLQQPFGFEVSTISLTDLFEEVATSLGFEMIEKQISHATAIKQSKKTFLQMINCFNWLSDANMTAVKMTIHTSEKNSTRICRIKGLVGSKKEVSIFINLFQQKSKQLLKTNQFQSDEQSQILNQPQNPFHLEACAAYMFHKILSNEQYGIGNILMKSIKDYNNTFADVEQSIQKLPIPMKDAIIIVKEIVDNLYKDFNLGRKEMQKIMPYCRISVEKYVFDKIQNVITPIYKQHSSQQSAIFQEKRTRIFNQKKLKQILNQVGLQKQNWLFEDIYSAKLNEKLEEINSKKEIRSMSKYRKACQEIQKMSFVKNPRQKMKHCQIAYSTLKTLIYENSKKKHELSNMQQIIPIFIWVILLSNISDLRAQLQIIIDFIQFDTCDLQSQKRLLLNLKQSFNFILRDWKI